MPREDQAVALGGRAFVRCLTARNHRESSGNMSLWKFSRALELPLKYCEIFPQKKDALKLSSPTCFPGELRTGLDSA
jgi:hypothetical protein